MLARISSALTYFAITFAADCHAQLLPPPPPGVQVTTSYGIEFSTIGSPGNAAHPSLTGPIPNPRLLGRDFGSVSYQYRLSRTEVTTGEWLQFVNTFSTQASFPTELWGLPSFTQETPVFWGATPDPTYTGPGVRYRLAPGVANAANLPVGGVSWRDAALYVNWLNNGQSSSSNALWNGAYDTSTFGVGSDGYTDQVSHNTNAQFWIPTYDEWAKGAYFNPAAPGSSAYYSFPTSSNQAPAYGPPGTGEANAGFELPNFGEWGIPVGSYPAVQSPWGLLDAAGSEAEWTESLSPDLADGSRWLAGSGAGDMTVPDFDTIGHVFPLAPGVRLTSAGLRIAASVPEVPAPFAFLIGSVILTATRRRRACGRRAGISRSFLRP